MTYCCGTDWDLPWSTKCCRVVFILLHSIRLRFSLKRELNRWPRYPRMHYASRGLSRSELERTRQWRHFSQQRHPSTNILRTTVRNYAFRRCTFFELPTICTVSVLYISQFNPMESQCNNREDILFVRILLNYSFPYKLFKSLAFITKHSYIMVCRIHASNVIHGPHLLVQPQRCPFIHPRKTGIFLAGCFLVR